MEAISRTSIISASTNERINNYFEYHHFFTCNLQFVSHCFLVIPIISCGQQIGAEIGRGGFAVVYQAFNVETGDFVALKRIPFSAVDDGALSIIQVLFVKYKGLTIN